MKQPLAALQAGLSKNAKAGAIPPVVERARNRKTPWNKTGKKTFASPGKAK